MCLSTTFQRAELPRTSWGSESQLPLNNKRRTLNFHRSLLVMSPHQSEHSGEVFPALDRIYIVSEYFLGCPQIVLLPTLNPSTWICRRDTEPMCNSRFTLSCQKIQASSQHTNAFKKTWQPSGVLDYFGVLLCYLVLVGPFLDPATMSQKTNMFIPACCWQAAQHVWLSIYMSPGWGFICILSAKTNVVAERAAISGVNSLTRLIGMSKPNSVMSHLFMRKTNPLLLLLVTSVPVCSSFSRAAGSYILPAKIKMKGSVQHIRRVQICS